MANEVRILVTADDKATKTLQGIQAAAVGLGAAVGVVAGQIASKMADAAVSLAVSSVKMASDFQESQNKVRVVFGETAATLEQFAANSARDFGLAKQATLEYLGTFGNLLTSMGLSRDASAGMSQGIVKLSADLASFNNIGVPEALEKIRAGLVGEVEPLRALGVNLNAAAVEAEALRMGLVKKGEALSAASKAQAAYSLILQQTSNAQGDFARTSDGLANQQRILGAQFADLKVKLGEQLLPVATELVTKLNEMVAVNGESWARGFADGLTMLASGFATAADKAGDFRSMLQQINSIGPDGWLTNVAKQVGAQILDPVGIFRAIGAANDIKNRLGDAFGSRLGRSGMGDFLDDAPNVVNAGATPLENVISNAWQTEKVAGVLSDAAKGAKSAMEELADAMEAAAEKITDQHTREIVEAFITGGQAQVDVVRETHKQLDEQWVGIAKQMHDVFGIEIPDEWRLMWEGMLKEQQDAAKRMVEAERKLADDRLAEMRRTTVEILRGQWAGGVGETSPETLAQMAATAAAASRNIQIGRINDDIAAGRITPGAGLILIQQTYNGIVGDPAAVGRQTAEALNAASRQDGAVLNAGTVAS